VLKAKPTDVVTYPAVVMPGPDGEGLADLDAARIDAMFRENGAVLFRGFGADLSAFKSFTRRFSPTAVFNESGERDVVDKETTIQTVNLGSAPFPLHPELSRVPWRPDLAFFCCQSAPTRDGQTTICDGVELVRRLPEEVRAWLSGRSFLYREPISLKSLQYWLGVDQPSREQLANPPAGCPFHFDVDEADGLIYRSFTAPVLYDVPTEDGPAFGNFLLFARFLLGRSDFPVLSDGESIPDFVINALKEVSDSLTVPVDWQIGDVLMLDNWRFMHGRRAIHSTEERLILTYFGYQRQDDSVKDADKPDLPPWRRLPEGTDWWPPGEGEPRPAKAGDLADGEDAAAAPAVERPSLTLENLFTKPDIYFFRMDGEAAQFAHMTAGHFQDSIFLDMRIKPASDGLAQVNMRNLLAVDQRKPVPRQPINFIFHIAHCGSTLLSRAFDRTDAALVYREPHTLRQIGVEVAQTPTYPGMAPLTKSKLSLALTMAQKRYLPTQPVIVKANVPVNLMLPDVMAGIQGSKGLLLYLPLEAYLLSILKSEANRSWIQGLCREIGWRFCKVLNLDPASIADLSIPQATGFVWLAQMRLFADAVKAVPGLKTLSAETFFQTPAPVLEALAKHFSVGLDRAYFDELTAGDLFNRHAKDPGRVFDDAARRTELEARKKALSGDLEEAMAWTRPKAKAAKLPKTIGKTLIGTAPTLY
jgi:alpha-ketoglutarate-dependent taurine dioxygenase